MLENSADVVRFLKNRNFPVIKMKTKQNKTKKKQNKKKQKKTKKKTHTHTHQTPKQTTKIQQIACNIVGPSPKFALCVL